MMEEKKTFFYNSPSGKKEAVSWSDSGGNGSVILFVHGLGPASEIWTEILGILPVQYRFICVDLNGFGANAVSDDSALSIRAQAEMLRAFILHLDRQDLILAAHSIGATAAVYALADPQVRACFSKVIFCSVLGMNRTIPPALEKIAGLSERNPLMRKISGDLSAYLLLSRLYANPDDLTDEMLHRTGAMLQRPGAAGTLAAVARRAYVPDQQEFCAILKELTMPVLLIWGAADRISPAEEAEEFRRQNSRFQLKILPECGHLPMWEHPAEMAEWMDQFILDAQPPALTEVIAGSVRRRGKSHLWHLFDRWNLDTLGFFLFLKFLKLLRSMGILHAEENGWRKATGIFMRNEASKFMLGCFRLRYYIGATPPEGYALAQRELIAQLAEFLQHQNPFHWCVVPGILQEGRRRHYFSDLVTAHYGADGRLMRLDPYFDPRHNDFSPLTEEQIRQAVEAVIEAYNSLIPFRGRYRTYRMKRRMDRYVRRCRDLQYAGRTALTLLVERLMTATCLHFEQLPEDAGEHSHLRLRMPAIKRYRHPGWGLLNIFCRFRHDFSEADLWVQFHHVPVDGAPMQELLQKLKRQWGSCGPISYPALHSPAAHPELIYCGDRLYRARFYVDFSGLLQVRREINEQYSKRMEGTATLAGMILWGLAQHPYFRRRKMLFPVESGASRRESGERELGLVFIRPSKFEHAVDPLTGFLRFQRAFNRMIAAAREGRGASDEFLNLASTVHPIFYHLTNRLLPETLQEIVGTVGVSIIRDAEMFISPLSDFQSGGFMAVGNVAMPSQDGRPLGAVSVCGERRQIRFYMEAMREMSADYKRFFASSENKSEENT